MTERPRDPADLLPLRPVVSGVLLALGRGPLHGYGIMERVNERLGEPAILGPGTLYRTLKELRGEGLLERVDVPHQSDARRQYYALTRWGRRVAAAEAIRLTSLVELAREGDLLT